MQEVAQEHGRAFVDCMTASVSFDWMQGRGFMADDIHVNSSGSAYLSNFVWNEMGFFSMRADRHLGIRINHPTLEVGWKAYADIGYSLEPSQDLRAWSVVKTGGTNFVTDISQAARYYRLNLSPAF